MKKQLQSPFNTRQYMISKDFEIYYYNDNKAPQVDLHSHDYYEFYFFLEGNISFQIKDKIYPVQIGDIMLIPPNHFHKPIFHDFTHYRRFVFWISQEYCNRLLEVSPDYAYLMQHVLITEDYLFHTTQIEFNFIQYLASQIIAEIHSNRFGKHAQISLSVNHLLLYLNRLVYQQHNPISKAEDVPLYEKILLYIEDHLLDDLSLEDLANQFYVSKYHIAHTFKNNLGISVHQYIIKKRLTLCREAILSQQSITKTYQTFGFKDYSSFYRAFKKEFGVSPKDCANIPTDVF